MGSADERSTQPDYCSRLRCTGGTLMVFTADYPRSKVVPAHPTNVLSGSNNPKVIVLHTPEEPADGHPGTPIYFQGANRGGSTHYYSHSSGDWYQMVPEKKGAIANGVKGKPYPAGTTSSKSLNYQSVNVEIEGYAASIATTMPRGKVQWKAVVKWVLFEAKKYKIPIDRRHIIGHYEVANNRSDPGTLNIQHIVDDVLALKAKEEGKLTMSEVRELKKLMRELSAKTSRFERESKKRDRDGLRFSKEVAKTLNTRLKTLETKVAKL